MKSELSFSGSKQFTLLFYVYMYKWRPPKLFLEPKILKNWIPSHIPTPTDYHTRRRKNTILKYPSPSSTKDMLTLKSFPAAAGIFYTILVYWLLRYRFGTVVHTWSLWNSHFLDFLHLCWQYKVNYSYISM